MTSLTRWERDLNRAFDNALRPYAGSFALDVPLDVYETDENVVVKAVVPGIAPEDIHVNVLGNTLTIKGEVSKEQESKERSYVIRERRFGSFSRSITLPNVEASEATAEFENGVLTLTLPKPEQAQPKSIKITSK